MMMSGRLVQGRGGLYTARDENGQEYVLRAKNRFRREGIRPLVGDMVRFTPGKLDEHGWIEEILPRTSYSIRPPVANITQLIILLAPEPQADLLLLDKLLIFAFRQGIIPLVLVNKSDLDDELGESIKKSYEPAGVRVIAASAYEKTGFDELKGLMKGHINCFAGQSGVGKSTLISRLTGFDLETGAVSRKTRRGRQTTRHISFIEQDGFTLLDTPGFSLFELPDEVEPEHLRDFYPEFTDLQSGCRFEVCLHNKEPDCAVQNAMEQGSLDPGRLERYRILLDTQIEKRSNRYA
ncbi:MAG: ribosome small subunit-dependent GTPase A [Bacillota bacterium]|nr:ribosome small subunit-dependent GTPase A [Bacillota bacterium]